jgi:hypothetical protein
MIRSMEGFTFASALDLNMSYYQIKLDADAQKLCTMVFPWGKYKYKRLPMGVKIAIILMFFKTSCLSLFKTWNMLRLTCYLDDFLMLTTTNNSFKDHLLKLEMILARLSTAGIISKSKFFAEQIEYLALGYWITRQGIQPIRNKVEAILDIKAPKTRK